MFLGRTALREWRKQDWAEGVQQQCSENRGLNRPTRLAGEREGCFLKPDWPFRDVLNGGGAQSWYHSHLAAGRNISLGESVLFTKDSSRTGILLATVSRKQSWELGEGLPWCRGEVCEAHHTICYNNSLKVFWLFDYLIFEWVFEKIIFVLYLFYFCRYDQSTIM